MPSHKENLAVLNLSMELFNGSTGNISKVDFEPSKTAAIEFPPTEKRYFERVTPESVGVSSLYVADFIKELRECPRADLHQLVMVKDGRVFAECSFAPYLKGVKHVSLSKSLTGLAIGMLIDDDKLTVDTRLTEIFGSKISFLNSLKLKNISVYHLLTMSSGSSFNESGALSGNDWLSAFFDASLNFPTGSRFEYNSMNSYILSAIVTEITGRPMDEFLKERLFDPLKIEDYLWERCPKGITKGGWGLYMRPEDVAKIGQLYLDKGVFDGKRIISGDWIISATKKQIATEREDELDYGYQVWVNKNGTDYMFNGMLQQNCFVFPENRMLIVTNAGSEELLTYSNVTRIVNKYFGEGYRAPSSLMENKNAGHVLLSEINRSENRVNVPGIKRGGWGRNRNMPEKPNASRLAARLNDLSYLLDNKSEGIMPLFMQVLHNNFTEGMSEISFESDNEGMIIHIKEGENTHHLAAGFKKDRYTTLDFRGEQYLVSGFARFNEDEDGDICLIIESAFIEEACRRRIKIFFKDSFERIKIELQEMPGEDVLLGAINAISPTEDSGFIMSKIKDLGAFEVFKRAASTKISPVIRGHLKESYDQIGENVLWARP